MPFPTALVFLFVLWATGLAIFCVVAGLWLFAIPRLRSVAPYVAVVYPATFAGGVFAVKMAWRLNTFLGGQFWRWQFMIVLMFLLVGSTMGTFLGYAVAERIGRRFPRAS